MSTNSSGSRKKMYFTIKHRLNDTVLYQDTHGFGARSMDYVDPILFDTISQARGHKWMNQQAVGNAEAEWYEIYPVVLEIFNLSIADLK